jgi:hypothetical protein
LNILDDAAPPPEGGSGGASAVGTGSGVDAGACARTTDATSVMDRARTMDGRMDKPPA